MQTSTNLSDVVITVYKDAYSKEPHHVTLKTVLERIKSGGKSLPLIKQVRAGNAAVKTSLPSICFSGVFDGARTDAGLKTHSGLVILDFDKMGFEELKELSETAKKLPYVVASFISPSGNGLKILVRIADGSKHRQHYRALMKAFPTLDEKNINEARVCFESYDPEIYINYDATPYTQYIETQRTTVSEFRTGNDIFNKIEIWIERKGKAYVTGSRNDFIFTLASACCRFGLDQTEVEQLIAQKYLSGDTEFTFREMQSAVKSAYARNKANTASFDTTGMVIDRETTKEVIIEDNDAPVKDVIYGSDVYEDAINIYHYGYKSAEPTGIPEIDRHFKWKRGELSVLTGIGNHGKSTFLKFLMLNKTCLDKTKWAVFGPEDFPAHEFYHDLTEMIIGANCTPENSYKPSQDVYDIAYKYVTEHIFYIYPKELSPTPEYIKSRFLQLILKEGVSGVIIDPFNQMDNDYNNAKGRDDKYLEVVLADFKRFALINNVSFVIVAHPHKLKKEGNAYPMPDVFDLAGGAMWNNKADNILVYHRPNYAADPTDRTCEFHSRKIRRQKIVGIPGTVSFEYNRNIRRFVFNDCELNNVKLWEPPRGEPMLRPLKHYSEPIDNDQDVPF